MDAMCISKLLAAPRFWDYALPYDGREHASSAIRDCTFFLRQDGLIINAEGWAHPDGLMLGEVLYVPDPCGPKTFFGTPYRKATLVAGSHEAVPYEDRPAILASVDPSLDQRLTNPYHARFKQLLARSSFIAWFPGRQSFPATVPTADTCDLARDLKELERTLHFSRREVKLRLAGSLALGQEQGYHDFDVVFEGSPKQNSAIAARIRALTQSDPSARLFEGRKAWSVRYVSGGRIMCCFFAYGNLADVPYRSFEVAEILGDDLVIEGRVISDTHAIYTPTIVDIENVDIRSATGTSVGSERFVRVVVYHTAARGDCSLGDQVRARGALVRLRKAAADGIDVVFCVIGRECFCNLTPPWSDYYVPDYLTLMP